MPHGCSGRNIIEMRIDPLDLVLYGRHCSNRAVGRVNKSGRLKEVNVACRLYPGKMNLPTHSICLRAWPHPAYPSRPLILSPLITTVAFGKTLPSAGLITVARRAHFLRRAGLIASKSKKHRHRRNCKRVSCRKCARASTEIKHQTSYIKHRFILSIRHRFSAALSRFRMRGRRKRVFSVDAPQRQSAMRFSLEICFRPLRSVSTSPSRYIGPFLIVSIVT